MDVIEIKAYFSGWHKATPHDAYKFVMHLYYGMTNLTLENRIKRINEKYLRGTTFEELQERFK